VATSASRLAARTRHDGVSAALRVALGSLVRAEREYVLAYPANELQPGDIPPGVEIEELDAARIHALESLFPAGELRRRIARGDRVLVSRLDGRTVGWAVLSRAAASSDLPFPLGDEETFAKDLYVEPEARRRGVGNALTRARSDCAHRSGYAWVLSVVRASNTRALGLQAKQRASVRGRLLRIVLLGRFRFVLALPYKGTVSEPHPTVGTLAS